MSTRKIAKSLLENPVAVKQIIKICFFAFLTVITIIWVVPILWTISTSLKSQEQILTLPPIWIPSPITWKNYLEALKQAPLVKWILNSGIISSATAGLVVIVCPLAGYALARLHFPGRNIMFLVIISTLMIPEQITIIPLYLFFKNLGILNTPIAVILPRIALALGVFLTKQFYEGIPEELEDAAKIDGCGHLKTFTHIIIPMSKPIIATLAIITFIGAWNAFLWPLIVLYSPSTYTTTVGIATLQSSYSREYGMMMAAAVIISIPVLIAFVLLQKYIIEGIMRSGVKG